MSFFFLMIRRPPRSTRTDTLFPYTTLFRSNYFAYAGKHPFRHLIYPTPEPGGLGTHLTLDLSGSARFGPDVEWISAIDYNVDEGRHSRFFKAAQKIWPAIEAEKLVPASCGIRPKIANERSEEQTSSLQSQMRLSYADFCE